jgi:hypothetical protein
VLPSGVVAGAAVVVPPLVVSDAAVVVVETTPVEAGQKADEAGVGSYAKGISKSKGRHYECT